MPGCGWPFRVRDSKIGGQLARTIDNANGKMWEAAPSPVSG
jgi:hypothetical protein